MYVVSSFGFIAISYLNIINELKPGQESIH